MSIIGKQAKIVAKNTAKIWQNQIGTIVEILHPDMLPYHYTIRMDILKYNPDNPKQPIESHCDLVVKTEEIDFVR